MIVQYRQVSDFRELVFRGPGVLEVRQGESESLSIEAPGAVLDNIVCRVASEKLHLGYKAEKVSPLAIYQTPIRYRLELKELSKITITGSGRVEIPDLDTDTLVCRLSGRSTIQLDQLTSDHLDVALAAAAQMRVQGDIESQFIVLGDSASYEAEDLMSDSADIRLTQNANASVRVNDQLTAYVGGQSTLSYIGYPEVKKVGAGHIVRRRKQLPESTTLNQRV